MKARYVATLIILLVVSGCEGREPPVTPVSPTPVAPRPPTPSEWNVPQANWRADATVVSRTGNAGCGWGTSVGEQRKGVTWRITINGESILLDEDMSNWPTDHIGFAGTLHGEEFTARYFQGDDYARWVCQFREAHLVGRFSPDFSTFEAMETLAWGVPGHETVVQRRWLASRM